MKQLWRHTCALLSTSCRLAGNQCLCIAEAMLPSQSHTALAGMEQLTQPLDGKRIGKGADGRGMQDVPASNEDWQKRSDGKSVKPDIPANSGKCATSLLQGSMV
jgi:hypothetical protein